MEDELERVLREDREVLESITETYPCKLCGESWPLTPQYWYRDARNDTGFSRRCKVCTDKAREKRSKRVAQVMERHAQSLDIRLMKAVFEELKRSDHDVEGLPHLARAVEMGLHMYGGLQGYLARLFANSCSAAPGSKIRLEYDKLLWGAIEKLTMAGQVSIPTDLMSDDDLKRELDKQLRLISASGERVDIQPPAEQQQPKIEAS